MARSMEDETRTYLEPKVEKANHGCSNVEAAAKAREGLEVIRLNGGTQVISQEEYTSRIKRMKEKVMKKKKENERKKKRKAAKAEAAAAADQLTAKARIPVHAAAQEEMEELEAIQLKEQSNEELAAATFRDFWNSTFSSLGTFEDITPIPAMCYTNSGSEDAESMEGLQIISVKVESVAKGLHWPLQVFGHVFMRDVIDRKRNIIFYCERDNCQTITKEDPYLALTGPTHGVVVSTVDPSFIEVDLKVRGTSKSEDKDLSNLLVVYRATSSDIRCYTSRLSTLEFIFCYIPDSVEATIIVKHITGSWPDGLGGVFTASSNGWKVKLLRFGDDDRLPVGRDGLISFSRRVVSVNPEEELKVCVMACDQVDAEQVVAGGGGDEATFTPMEAGMSSAVELEVGSCRMQVNVAWSLFDDCNLYLSE